MSSHPDTEAAQKAAPAGADVQAAGADVQAAGAEVQAAARRPLPAEHGNVEQPAKLLRIAVMVREMLEEVRRAPLDEHARETMADIHGRVVSELKTGLSGPLVEELDRITMPLDDADVPTESQIRIAQAQLLGWLEGLFQGIQAAIATQQMAAAAQLEEMRRRGLPAGAEEAAQPSRPGQYL